MAPRSRLHVPHPPARPGQEPDFSYLEISPAGAVNRPDITAAVRDIENLSLEMVRVLDDEHRSVGPWNPHLEAEELQVGLRHMLLTRLFDDRMQKIQRQGRISFYIKSTGEEAVAVAQGMALQPTDMLFPSYRQQGLHVVRGRNLVDLMCQCLSNTRDMCKGRQMPIMYHWGSGNIFTISGNLATQFPQAVGWAMAAAIKAEDRLAASRLDERRSLSLPAEGGVAGMAARGPDHTAQAAPDRPRGVVRGASCAAREGARGVRDRLLEGGRILRNAHRRAGARSAHDVRGRVEADAAEPRAPARGAACAAGVRGETTAQRALRGEEGLAHGAHEHGAGAELGDGRDARARSARGDTRRGRRLLRRRVPRHRGAAEKVRRAPGARHSDRRRRHRRGGHRHGSQRPE